VNFGFRGEGGGNQTVSPAGMAKILSLAQRTGKGVRTDLRGERKKGIRQKENTTGGDID